MKKKLANLSPPERLEVLQDQLTDCPEMLYSILCPLSSFDIEAERYELPTTTKSLSPFLNILAVLDCFDRVFRNLFNFNVHIYLLGDNTVFNLFHYGGPTDILDNDLMKQLELLATIGLIYRFNVAKKFGYAERDIVQLRINSWGRFVVEIRDLQTLPFLPELSSQLYKVLSKYKQDYEAILKICNSSERPLEDSLIHSINSRIPLPVVT
jgi:hypothetical protein